MGDESPEPQAFSLRIKFMDARETLLAVSADAAIADVAEKVRPPGAARPSSWLEAGPEANPDELAVSSVCSSFTTVSPSSPLSTPWISSAELRGQTKAGVVGAEGSGVAGCGHGWILGSSRACIAVNGHQSSEVEDRDTTDSGIACELSIK